MSQTKINVGMIDASSIGDAKVLQGNGAWVTPSAGSLSFVSTAVASNSASIAFTGIDSSVDTWEIHFEGVVHATNSTFLYVTTSTDGGSSYASGSYAYGNIGLSGAGVIYFSSSSAAQIQMTWDPARTGTAGTTNSHSGVFHIHKPSDSALYSLMQWEMVTTDGTYANVHKGSGMHKVAADVDAVKFAFSSGNITSGRFSLHKLAHA